MEHRCKWRKSNLWETRYLRSFSVNLTRFNTNYDPFKHKLNPSKTWILAFSNAKMTKSITELWNLIWPKYNLIMLSCTLFWDVTLGWYHEILGWRFIIIYWKTEKNLFWTNKKFVYLNIITNFCPKITSQNIVPKTWNGLLFT